MSSINLNKKGVVLFMVLGTLLVVIILANVVLAIISSQSRLTHHQVSRIQAYYAAQAGMNLALENLRTGTWTFSPTNSCPDTTPCIVTDSDFPVSVQSVNVIFCPSGSTCTGTTVACTPGTGLNFCLNTVVDYTHTP